MINETSAVPPPPPAVKKFPAPAPAKPPVVTPTGPEGAFLVELMMYNGSPFKDHWAYWVSSHMSPEIGVAMDAAGDVRSGFEFQIRRCPDLSDSSNQPWKMVPLQWVDGKHFDETKMLNGGEFKVDTVPVCGFEASAHKVEVPEKSLNSVEEMVDTSNVGKKISQRNCQTWIVESADQLVKDGIFDKEVAAYLQAVRQ
ncbi:uncharacterized protein ASPGLDRAFT_73010 [Aspergillus glaucus CBS 516.65]|uniref:Uncharacterized protein n=1 Tax=Aspergillus glaucus CBS 516.65 TaxID=1160497 RepID=A0A1L9VSF0_ASPGL|nr:hypothetical protein ASPGLDRAFT_73010 [Aspergillus glaucus CBS 516.65]OJJ86822.1 hypothetical protein ASPGLDRAFT_73010 [Aspergillus glaucus CBS 516.65]